jgi:hypothetical protein
MVCRIAPTTAAFRVQRLSLLFILAYFRPAMLYESVGNWHTRPTIPLSAGIRCSLLAIDRDGGDTCTGGRDRPYREVEMSTDAIDRATNPHAHVSARRRVRAHVISPDYFRETV